jgi:FixJ family two-component response regulator
VTVKIHRAQAMHKLNASSVADVVKKLQQVLQAPQGGR